MALAISKKIMRQLGRTNAHYNLIEEGDKVLVGLSGGKDSLTMCHALRLHQRRTPFNFEMLAVTVTYGMGEDFSALQEHTRAYDIPHEIYETNTFDVAQDKIRKNSSFCSFFSRMRRGSLYSAAQKYGCNKVALAHHLDDAAESFMMNLIYNGHLRSLAPKYKAENGLVVIRPFIQVRERQLLAAAQEHAMPIVGDEMCPGMRFDVKMPHARASMKEMLNEMESKYPDLFVSMNAAFGHMSLDSFFDEQYLSG